MTIAILTDTQVIVISAPMGGDPAEIVEQYCEVSDLRMSDIDWREIVSGGAGMVVEHFDGEAFVN